MEEKLRAITLKPIGVVRNVIKEPMREGWKNVISEIVIDNSLTEALDNLDEFSHIIILYWMHLRMGKVPMKVRPKGKAEAPLVGVFASRSPNRPNSIGKSTVRLLERRGNILRVEGLDAIDGTPVLDIKPYIPGHDSVDDANVPEWLKKLHDEH